jgi:hypothetical protein
VAEHGDMPIHEERRIAGTSVMAVGTLACPGCDAPVLPAGPIGPSAALACPYCGHDGVVRDFLSLGEPTRPARVVVRVRAAARA